LTHPLRLQVYIVGVHPLPQLPLKFKFDLPVHLFFARFLPQVPLIHAPTWNIAATLPILMRIFRACGALFAKTPEGAGFAEMTLSDIVSDVMVESSRVSGWSGEANEY
jgi:hypothetical protein